MIEKAYKTSVAIPKAVFSKDLIFILEFAYQQIEQLRFIAYDRKGDDIIAGLKHGIAFGDDHLFPPENRNQH